jgi:type II secretory pathway component GspD/PulD (secretin)
VVSAEIRRRFPEARFTIEAGSVVVDSTVEVSAAIQRLLEGAPSRPKAPAAKVKAEKKRYTLRVQDKSLGAVAAAVAKEVGVELRFDPGAEALRDKLVWLDVKEVTLDQLLRTLLESGGLTYRLDEQTLEIRPASTP